MALGTVRWFNADKGCSSSPEMTAPTTFSLTRPLCRLAVTAAFRRTSGLSARTWLRGATAW